MAWHHYQVVLCCQSRFALSIDAKTFPRISNSQHAEAAERLIPTAPHATDAARYVLLSLLGAPHSDVTQNDVTFLNAWVQNSIKNRFVMEFPNILWYSNSSFSGAYRGEKIIKFGQFYNKLGNFKKSRKFLTNFSMRFQCVRVTPFFINGAYNSINFGSKPVTNWSSNIQQLLSAFRF